MGGSGVPQAMMHRAFARDACAAQLGQVIALDAEESRHIRSVLRLGAGARIEVIDGVGGRYAAELCADGGARLLCALPGNEPLSRVTLFQGLPKGDKLEEIIQRATELGAKRIVPVAMERCVMKLDARDAEKRLERWRRVAREAAKQCGRGFVPEIEAPVSLSAACARLGAVALLAWEEAETGDLRDYARAGIDVDFLIGPEGGITPAEAERLMAAGAKPITLGARILRTQTAGPALIAAWMAITGEWRR